MGVKEASAKKNYLYQIFYQIFTMIVPFITAPYVSRVLGASGIGVYTLTYSVASYFVLAAKLGIHVYGSRTIAAVRDDKDRLNRVFSELLLVHQSFSLVVLAAYLVYAFIAEPAYKLVALVQSLYIVGEMFEVDWLFFGLEKFKVTVTRSTVVRLLTVALVFLLVKSKDDVGIYCAILAGGTALSRISVWVLVPRCVKIVKIAFRDAYRHFKPLVSFFIPSIAVSLYKVMDKIMLGGISGPVQVGLYENSEKLVSLALGFVTALGTVMMPRMTNLSAKGKDGQSKKIIGRSMNAILILTFAMAFGISGVANVFAPVFFGREFTSCDILMIGLSVSMPFTAFANVLRTQYLIPNRHDRAYQGSVITGAAVNLLVNFLLIPRMRALGAVIGTIIAEATVCLIQMFFSRKELPIARYLRMGVPYALFGGMMLAIVRLIGNRMGASVVTLLVQVAAGALFYTAACALYLYLRKDELWQTLQRMFRKVGRGPYANERKERKP